ncbi:hypothetical protein [Sediminibacillus massiliensis]|uniref:hypothetical protein n=1 Tax=Sediminibacillus massiliensis TaxID=1926277 RepID=UPI00098862C6|nr:hypothetical protein [Sediminibacillus massiliensis]
MSSKNRTLSYRQLTAFFIPLGFSASLTSISHVIINGTLSRGEEAAYIIACYAVAFSLFGIVEKPIIVFRQTSSALVKDYNSFKKLSAVFVYVTIVMILISFMIGFTAVGDWMFIHLFNADANMVDTISLTFRWIALVIIFSGIRGIYQGVIINHHETNWLTIGVVIRLAVMFLVAFWFVSTNRVHSMAGAAIFLTGMIVECMISAWKGHRLLLQTPVEKESTLENAEIMPFYMPLVFYFFIQTILQPIIYVFLAQSANIELSIASFALAFAVSQLMLSFFMYTHQIVLQFYQTSKAKVIKFTILLSLIPTIMLVLMSYTPFGIWTMKVVMGADPSLSDSTLFVLQFFIVKVLVFPWVDFLNGFIMLQRRTGKMLAAQVVNLISVFVSLLALVHFFPQLNGANGAIAASVGELMGLVAVIMIISKDKAYRLFRVKVNAG